MRKTEGDEARGMRVVVTGRVQGVGYRFFVQREAVRLGLRGWVRNLDNGDVEVVAAGPRAGLERLLQRLREGPPLAWVDDVGVQWQEPDGSLRGFNIRPTAW